MNDTIYVNELLQCLKTTGDPGLFDALFTMYIYRYQQVFSNTIQFTVVEKIPFSLQKEVRSN